MKRPINENRAGWAAILLSIFVPFGAGLFLGGFYGLTQAPCPDQVKCSCEWPKPPVWNWHIEQPGDKVFNYFVPNGDPAEEAEQDKTTKGVKE